MLTDWVTIRLSREQLEKLRAMSADGSPSVSEWLRQRIDAEYDAFSSRREQEDAVAREQLSPEEIEVAGKLGVSLAGYLAAKR